MSPFSSEPATTSPVFGALTEFNVKLANKNVIANNIKYGWEVFQQNVYGDNAINGGQVTGLTSGLINERMWKQNYQYYTFDCSRFQNSEMPVGVELVGMNNSLVALDLHVFIEIEREFILDLSTGARL